MPIETITISETGCYLDAHRGHYAIPAMIELAIGWGFIVGPFERFALDHYDEHYHEENYPSEAVIELADEAESWLNVGENSGIDRPLKGQNSPPTIPAGHHWAWWEGDFGLYSDDQLTD